MAPALTIEPSGRSLCAQVIGPRLEQDPLYQHGGLRRNGLAKTKPSPTRLKFSVQASQDLAPLAGLADHAFELKERAMALRCGNIAGLN